MKIDIYEIPVRRVFEGYEDLSNNEGGVFALNGRLTCRPEYQREFVYKEKERDEVIQTVRKKFPLNVMYWVRTDKHEENSEDDLDTLLEQGTFELLDGQQRTLSLMQYINGDYPIKWDDSKKFFHNLTEDQKELILDYKLNIYICEGNQSEVLDWFKIINLGNVKLTDQELLNAIYTGPWLSDAKRYFSKTNCAAYQMGNKLMNGSPIRQDFLETALKWITEPDNKDPEDYMAEHQYDTNCNELWAYFNAVITWVNMLFPKNHYRPIMKGQPWGVLYNHYHNSSYDASSLEEKVKELLLDDEVGNNRGVYEYIFTEDEKYLNLRAFSEKDKTIVFERQGGKCPMCKRIFAYAQMEGDHIVPWHDGGKTEIKNLQMLCKHCNRTKSGK
ncbi:MAG: HNH endonuclease [Lachnospiraceae bacterium]|nr:HNH endonuclease [Lachnospiraceae bacterium]